MKRDQGNKIIMAYVERVETSCDCTSHKKSAEKNNNIAKSAGL